MHIFISIIFSVTKIFEFKHHFVLLINQIITILSQNLYGYAMSEKMPVDGFQWVKATNWTQDTIMRLDGTGSKGYILEVDIEIPESIHQKTDMYPLCPEHMEITESMISPKSRLLSMTVLILCCDI